MKNRVIYLNGKEVNSTEGMSQGLENAISNAADMFEDLDGVERKEGVHTFYDGMKIDVVEINED
ncbi:MAG: hypothetical protein LUD27_00735 [Clostridia bacterium]|nr:hypothetical protein [Clostridia bacterium]